MASSPRAPFKPRVRMRVVAQCAFDNMFERVLDRRGVRIGDGRAQTLPRNRPYRRDALVRAEGEVEPRRAFLAPRVLGELLPIGREAIAQAVERIRADR